VTACVYNRVTVIPSCTDISFDTVQKCFVGTVCVVNTTAKQQKGVIKGKIETINNYNPISITEKSMPKLRTQMGIILWGKKYCKAMRIM